jgi:hypothetical protein
MKESLRITDEGVHILQKMKMKNMEAPLDAEANVEVIFPICVISRDADKWHQFGLCSTVP